jgi:hypothetical protein
MELSSPVQTVRTQLEIAAAPGDDATRQAAVLLGAAVEPALRIALQDAASQLAGEISAQLAPGRVELRLHPTGLEAVVSPAPDADAMPVPPGPPAPPVPPTGDPAGEPAPDGSTARVTFRPPQQLKERLDAAATAEGLSLNAYLVRVLGAHVDGRDSTGGSWSGRGRERRSGSVRGWYV